MIDFNEDQFIKSWILCRESEEESSEHNSSFWAVEKFWEIIENDPEYGWELILKILAKNVTENVVVLLAAKELEGLLSEHGKQFIDRVEEEAKKNRKLAWALGGVWQNDIPDAIWERVKKARITEW